jgi:hypothetical protein
LHRVDVSEILNPDGSNMKTIVNEGPRIPNGVAVDVAAGHIYWTNMGNPGAKCDRKSNH